MIFKEETRIMSSTDDQQFQETLNTEISSMEEANMRRAKVKMEQVREENVRLKQTLSQIMKDYHSLKMQFNGITTQEDHESKKPTTESDDESESELVSLSLGRFSADSKKIKSSYHETTNQQLGNDGTQLGLNWKLNPDSSAQNLKETSFDESKEEEAVRSSRRSPKNPRINEDDEILQLQHNSSKKPRVSVRAVCNTQTMHDGCQWRKYGQKISKGNPCPRAYYRCTVSSSCPVRKQVQRCIDDMNILVTTYEGSHNHPLPPSAVTMASATSAAVAMLSCGVSATSTTVPAPSTSLFGFNSNNFPRATISSSQSHPTVILDLTAPNHTNKFSPSTLFSATPKSFNFSSFDANKFPAINIKAVAPPYTNSQPPLFPSIQKQAANDHTIAAATKTITHDPMFQSALAAAITSFVGNNSGNGTSSAGLNFHMNFSQPSTSNASIGCAASFMNRFPQPLMKSQQNINLTHFAPLTLSASKPQTMSLADEGEQIKL